MPQTLTFRLAARCAQAAHGCRLHVLSGDAVLALWRGGIADPERAMVAVPAGDVLCVGFRSTSGELHLCVNRAAAPPDSYKRAMLPFVVLDVAIALRVIAEYAMPDDMAQCAAIFRDGRLQLIEQQPRPGFAVRTRSQRMEE